MAMGSVAVGYILGGRRTFEAWEMASAFLGILVVAISCSFLQPAQSMHREGDGRSNGANY